jgi:hypothetical protein
MNTHQFGLSARLIAVLLLLALFAFGCAPHAEQGPAATSPQAGGMPTQPRIPAAVLEMQKDKTKDNQ